MASLELHRTGKLSNFSIIRALLVVGVPIMVSLFGRNMLTLVDNLMVGHLDNASVAVAGVAMAAMLWMLTFRFNTGISTALNSLLAQDIGRQDIDSISAHLISGILLTLIIPCSLTILITFLIEPILYSLNVSKEVVRISASYFRTFAPFTVPGFLMFTFSSYYRALGRSDIPMWLDVISIPLNIALDYSLIYGKFGLPRFGVRGAALGSGITILTEFLALLLLYMSSRIPQVPLSISSLKFPSIIKASIEVIKLALPATLEGLTMSIAQFAVVYLISDLGPTALGAYRLTIRFQGILILLATGFSVSSTTVVGQLIGMKRWEEAKRAGWYSSLLSTSTGLTIAVIMWILAPILAKISTSDIQLASELGVSIRWILPAVVLFDAINPLMGALKGAKDTLSPFLLTLFGRLFIRIPLIFILRTYFRSIGLGAVWTAFIIDNLVRIVIGVYLWSKRRLYT